MSNKALIKQISDPYLHASIKRCLKDSKKDLFIKIDLEQEINYGRFILHFIRPKTFDKTFTKYLESYVIRIGSLLFNRWEYEGNIILKLPIYHEETKLKLINTIKEYSSEVCLNLEDMTKKVLINKFMKLPDLDPYIAPIPRSMPVLEEVSFKMHDKVTDNKITMYKVTDKITMYKVLQRIEQKFNVPNDIWLMIESFVFIDLKKKNLMQIVDPILHRNITDSIRERDRIRYVTNPEGIINYGRFMLHFIHPKSFSNKLYPFVAPYEQYGRLVIGSLVVDRISYIPGTEHSFRIRFKHRRFPVDNKLDLIEAIDRSSIAKIEGLYEITNEELFIVLLKLP